MTYTHARAPFGFGFAEWDILGDDVAAVMGLLHPTEDLMHDVPHDGEVLRGMLRPRAAGVLAEEYVDLMTGITEEMAIRARDAEDE